MIQQPQYLTPQQFATQTGATYAQVIGWILAGELDAEQISKGKRPQYRIPVEVAAMFRREKANALRGNPRGRQPFEKARQ